MIAYMHVSMIVCYSAMSMQDWMFALSVENLDTKRECKVPQFLAKFSIIFPSFPAFNICSGLEEQASFLRGIQPIDRTMGL